MNAFMYMQLFYEHVLEFARSRAVAHSYTLEVYCDKTLESTLCENWNAHHLNYYLIALSHTRCGFLIQEKSEELWTQKLRTSGWMYENEG